MVTAMNRRASILTKVEAEWTKQGEFEELLRWTRNASPKELADFAEDLEGRTYPKRLFLSLMCNNQ
jgi:hypothetical protein